MSGLEQLAFYTVGALGALDVLVIAAVYVARRRYQYSYFSRPSVRFEKHDLWIGVYWDRWRSAAGDRPYETRWTYYVCLVPTIVVQLGWRHNG